MQPAAAPEGEGVKRVRGEVQEGPVNEEGWWKRSQGSVPADQVCLSVIGWSFCVEIVVDCHRVHFDSCSSTSSSHRNMRRN